MKALFKKSPEYGFLPCCDESMELFDKIPNNALVSVEYNKKRNYKNLKRFFEFINITFDMQDFYDNKENFRKAIQMIAGHYEELIIVGKDGEVSTHYIPKSINFDEMEECDFQELFKRCITGFINRYGNGITERDLMRVIEFD